MPDHHLDNANHHLIWPKMPPSSPFQPCASNPIQLDADRCGIRRNQVWMQISNYIGGNLKKNLLMSTRVVMATTLSVGQWIPWPVLAVWALK